MIITFVIIQLMLKPDSMFSFKSIQCSYLIGISIAAHKFYSSCLQEEGCEIYLGNVLIHNLFNKFNSLPLKEEG